MRDAVIISDLHLGSDNCQARLLGQFLHELDEDRPGRLILNGDVFDSIDFRRLKKHHWKVLSELRRLSDEMEIVWLNGNHDGPAEIISHLLGVTVQDDYEFTSGGRRFLVLHGHVFDEFIDNHPIVTRLADAGYWLLQRLDPSHGIARWAKHRSKTFLRCTDKIEHGAVALAKQRGCDAVCCGHTHFPVERTASEPHYFNSGCWTELPCNYLIIEDGTARVERFAPVAEAAVAV